MLIAQMILAYIPRMRPHSKTDFAKLYAQLLLIDAALPFDSLGVRER